VPRRHGQILPRHVQHASAVRKQILRPIASHSEAGSELEPIANRHDPDGAARRIAGLPPKRREVNFLISIRGLENRSVEHKMRF
jgi:hypothetical protein